MKQKNIKSPADLLKGDFLIFVSWKIHKATPAIIDRVVVDDVFKETYLNKMYGPGPNGLGIEWDPKRWVFQKRGAWDFREIEFGAELRYQGDRIMHKIYRIDQLDEAKRFAEVEVPKKQLAAVMKRMDKLKQDFTNKIAEMEKLEKILRNCNTVPEINV